MLQLSINLEFRKSSYMSSSKYVLKVGKDNKRAKRKIQAAFP
jgi:hypothetical protein